MKRWLTAVGITSVLMGSILAGCGGGDEKAANKETSGNNGEKVEVTLAGWGGNPSEQKLLQQTLDEFEKKHPNIKVKLEVISEQYMDVIKTRLIGGEGPDVFYLDAFEAPALIETGVLEPLDQYVTDDFDIDDFEKPLLDAFKGKDGHIYGFPKDYSTLALFYNKKMFKEAGVEVPKTWDELRETAKKLTKGTEVYGFGVAPELARLYYIAESKGGKVVTDNKASFADPKVVEALQPIVDMHLKDKSAAQPSEVGANWGGEMFGQGKAAMVIEGNWAIPFLQDTFPNLEFGTAEVPSINGKKATMAYTVAYVMNKDSKKKKAAWELISYLTGKEGMKIWTSKGYALPTRKSVAKELGYDKDPLRAPLVAGASYATVWQKGTNLPIIVNNFNNQFVSAFLGERPLNEALKEAEKTANKEIDSK
ncbi:ABC transporter substrate-binding protein [Parageobacillus thermoglucosidasius]|uniref:Extracellular solute-binding protein n=3 Tax=Anoxybacillaceae TaxID=3120669 RepID=A0AB38R1H9_PARTM|nr:ABC transporter substrate-binding protein [Parageobacillus thermoglucosidasius]MED4903249.1 extracellular solute-binding protein [Parageobacillus thermoglucosidasius]MED4914674.1 extracellular solute-binding protein [Parageobacillus thermoglucosidasius]MED4946299.1 extracellular solute-binding protein [Parageobacillus thermoglucosidasius]MED4982519.1 extracellular solute-binding protein [Parageobacillus thermoglucosidasius]OUM90544.1 MAG: sugar transporter [Parageobacillus thermoglucosidasi